MYEYAHQNEKRSRTLDASSGTSRQASIQMILQTQRLPLNEKRTPERKVIQQMILPLWQTEEDKKVFLKQGEIQSRNLKHGKIINRSNLVTDKNLSGIGEREDLHIIGHGNPQTVAGMSPEVLADLVVKNLKLPPTYKGRIYLESCESGTELVSLEGSYASRFIQALNALRGEESSPLTAVGFDGAVVLDNAFPGRTMLRILKKGVSLEMFREYAVLYAGMSACIVKDFMEKLEKEDLQYYVKSEEMQDLLFHIYNTKISQYAEPQGGGLTKLYIWGTEYQGIPNADPNITDIMDRIKTEAQTEKTDMGNIPMIELDLGDLKLEVKK